MEKHKKSLHDDDITRDGSFERKASTFRNWISKGAHKYITIFGAKALNGSLGPGTQDPNEGTQMLGPKYWDPNSEVRNVRVPSAGTHHPGTQMKGPRYWDPNAWM